MTTATQTTSTIGSESSKTMAVKASWASDDTKEVIFYALILVFVGVLQLNGFIA